MWDEYGPGRRRRRLGHGGLLGLALHLRGGSVGDPMAWQLSAEGRAFSTRSSAGVGRREPSPRAPIRTASQRDVANTTAFYAPEPPAGS